MDFSKVKSIVIPEGNVTKITDTNNTRTIWQKKTPNYMYILCSVADNPSYQVFYASKDANNNIIKYFSAKAMDNIKSIFSTYAEKYPYCLFVPNYLDYSMSSKINSLKYTARPVPYEVDTPTVKPITHNDFINVYNWTIISTSNVVPSTIVGTKPSTGYTFKTNGTDLDYWDYSNTISTFFGTNSRACLQDTQIFSTNDIKGIGLLVSTQGTQYINKVESDITFSSWMTDPSDTITYNGLLIRFLDTIYGFSYQNFNFLLLDEEAINQLWSTTGIITNLGKTIQTSIVDYNKSSTIPTDAPYHILNFS